MSRRRLFRIVHARGAILNEGGPTLSRHASLIPVSRRDSHPGLQMPACHALAAVTLRRSRSTLPVINQTAVTLP